MRILLLAGLLLGTAAVNAAAANILTVKNEVDYALQVTLQYYHCKGDHGTVKPGAVYTMNARACCLRSVVVKNKDLSIGNYTFGKPLCASTNWTVVKGGEKNATLKKI